MRLTVILFCAVILLLLTGVIPSAGGAGTTAVYTSPVMILLLALLSAASIRCCFKRRPAGFLLVHIGVVVILAGALTGYIAGTRGTLRLSLMPSQPVGQLLTVEGDTVSFGFDVAAEDFQVKFYPPVYQLYRKLSPEEAVPGQMPYKKAGEFNAGGQGVCVVEGFGPVSNLWNEARQEWTQRRMLPDGSVLNLAGQTPSYFGVTLVIAGKKLPVSINHPADFNGWRFYLMSYDQLRQSYVMLSVRRDPGRPAVIAGIWLTIAGAFIFCFRKEKRV